MFSTLDLLKMRYMLKSFVLCLHITYKLQYCYMLAGGLVLHAKLVLCSKNFEMHFSPKISDPVYSIAYLSIAPDAKYSPWSINIRGEPKEWTYPEFLWSLQIKSRLRNVFTTWRARATYTPSGWADIRMRLPGRRTTRQLSTCSRTFCHPQLQGVLRTSSVGASSRPTHPPDTLIWSSLTRCFSSRRRSSLR